MPKKISFAQTEGLTNPSAVPTHLAEAQEWDAVRDQFDLTTERIQMGLMLVAPHPARVREAIEKYRRLLDSNPVEYVKAHRETHEREVAAAAAEYLQASPEEIALTDSTTMGLALLYSGLKLGPGDDVLTTVHEHYSSDRTLEFVGRRSGATVRRVRLYAEPAEVSVDEVLGHLARAILPSTRVVAATYVHSGTGVKLPIGEMSAVIREANERRDEAEHIYFCVDAVHALGVEDFTVAELGCDFLVAGTHKWLFGPRGTGILWAKTDAWEMVDPIVPAFSTAFNIWMGIAPPQKLSFFEKMSPGGFHAFEHSWALKEAFEFHLNIGKERIRTQTHFLNTMLKDGMAEIPHLKLHTPRSSALSSGLSCFEVEGVGPREVIKRLLDLGIVGTIAPYRKIYPRLAPCVLNTEAEVIRCVRALAELSP